MRSYLPAFLVSVMLTFYPCKGYGQRISSVGQLLKQSVRTRPVLDSAQSVAHVSRKQRLQLISRIYSVDQGYRRKLQTPGMTINSALYRSLAEQMRVNDPVNQALLLKVLREDGWPCDAKKGELSSAFKAWWVIWHARGNLESFVRFEPYVLQAQADGCLPGKLIETYTTRLGQLRKAYRRDR